FARRCAAAWFCRSRCVPQGPRIRQGQSQKRRGAGRRVRHSVYQCSRSEVQLEVRAAKSQIVFRDGVLKLGAEPILPQEKGAFVNLITPQKRRRAAALQKT